VHAARNGHSGLSPRTFHGRKTEIIHSAHRPSNAYREKRKRPPRETYEPSETISKYTASCVSNFLEAYIIECPIGNGGWQAIGADGKITGRWHGPTYLALLMDCPNKNVSFQSAPPIPDACVSGHTFEDSHESLIVRWPQTRSVTTPKS
jgi:hypothetical protein